MCSLLPLLFLWMAKLALLAVYWLAIAGTIGNIVMVYSRMWTRADFSHNDRLVYAWISFGQNVCVGHNDSCSEISVRPDPDCQIIVMLFGCVCHLLTILGLISGVRCTRELATNPCIRAPWPREVAAQCLLCGCLIALAWIWVDKTSRTAAQHLSVAYGCQLTNVVHVHAHDVVILNLTLLICGLMAIGAYIRHARIYARRSIAPISTSTNVDP